MNTHNFMPFEVTEVIFAYIATEAHAHIICGPFEVDALLFLLELSMIMYF